MIGAVFKEVASGILKSLEELNFVRNCYPISWQVEDGQVITYENENSTMLAESSIGDAVMYGAYIRDLDRMTISSTGQMLGACNEESEAVGQFKLVAFTYDSIDKYKLLDVVLGAIVRTPRLPNTPFVWHQKTEITEMSTDFQSIFKAETKQEEMPQGELKLVSIAFRASFKFNQCSFEPKTLC